MNTIKYELADGAVVPKRGTDGSAGYDLYSIDDGIILPNKRKMFNIGVKLAIPPDHYGRIAPRSGLAFKNGIDVLAGVLDSDYRDFIKVILLNTDDKEFIVKKGDRIAQIIFEKISTPIFVKSELDDTNRGIGGFGSTG